MAVKCPFCGDRIESRGEGSGGLVSCPTCHATVDVQLADPLEDAAPPRPPAGQPAPAPRPEPPPPPSPRTPPAQAVDASGEPVGSYSLRSNDMKHAKETVFDPAAFRAAPVADAPRAVPPVAPRPATPPSAEGLRFRDVTSAPPPPPPPPPPKMSVAYRPDQLPEASAGPEIPTLPPQPEWGAQDMNATLDRLSGFVMDTPPTGAPAAPPPRAPAPEPPRGGGGVRLDDLDLSFDDLQPLRSDSEAVRAAGDPGTTFDIDAVMKEESFTDKLPPWAPAEPVPQRAQPPSESPWQGMSPPPASPRPPARGAADAPPPATSFETSSIPGLDDWNLPPGPGPGAAPPPKGVPDYDFSSPGVAGPGGAPGEDFGATLFEGAGTGPLQLDMGSAPPADGGLGGPSGPAQAPDSPARKGKVPRKPAAKGRRTKGAGKGVGRPVVLALLLIVVVGLILGQTEYGYFGLNLMGGPAPTHSAGGTRTPAPGVAGQQVLEMREAFQNEIVRIERLLVDDPKDEALRGELLEVLARLRERYPTTLAAEPRLVARLKELVAQMRLQGVRADLVRAMDLIALDKWEEARTLLDRLGEVAPGDATVPYLQGKVAMGQGRLDDAVKMFDVALAKDPGRLAALYFQGRAHLARKDVVRARTAFEAVLAREAGHLPAREGLAEATFMAGDVEGAARMAHEMLAKAQPGTDADEIYGAHVLLSRVEDQKGSREGRLRSLRAALGVRPLDVAVAVDVSTVLREDGKTADALAVLAPCREARKDDESFLRAYATAAYADDKAELAEAAIAEGIQKHPKAAIFHVLRGKHELELRRLRSAASSFEAALKVDAGSVEAYRLMARTLASEGKVGEAIEQLKEGLERTGQNIQLLLALAELQKAQRDLTGAETTLRQALSRDPGNARAQQDLGLIVAAQGRMEESAKILGDLDGRRGLDRAGVMGLARALLALHQPAGAREVLKRVADAQTEDMDVAAELGLATLEAGQVAEAEQILRKVLQQRPGHGVSHYYLGILLTRRNARDGAIDAYENSIRANAQDPRPRIELARLHLQAGDIESVRMAKQQLDAVLASYGRNEVADEERDPDAYLMHGQILFQEQKYSLAMKDFEAALARAPMRTDILVSFARTLYEAARYDEARPYLKQVLSRDPQNPEANYLTGRILVREGHTRQAREHLERLVQRDPRSFPDAHRVLGMIYRDEGLHVLAKSSFTSFLKYANPKSAEAEEVRQLLGRMR